MGKILQDERADLYPAVLRHRINSKLKSLIADLELLRRFAPEENCHVNHGKYEGFGWFFIELRKKIDEPLVLLRREHKDMDVYARILEERDFKVVAQFEEEYVRSFCNEVFDPDEFYQELRDAIQNESHILMVAETNNHVRGFLWLEVRVNLSDSRDTESQSDSRVRESALVETNGTLVSSEETAPRLRSQTRVPFADKHLRSKWCPRDLRSFSEGKHLSPTGRYGYIHNIQVDPKHRRRGIGTYLMDAAERYFQERGITRMRLHLLPANVAAYELYQRRGYHPAQYTFEKNLLPGQNLPTLTMMTPPTHI